tara:strand:- start:778 stop:1470 length:693 start_codon:yes stop_codon:yes gene_type:complete
LEIIAEIGQNHNGDLELACELIRKAKICGADVAKFQLYDAKNLFPKEGNEWYEYNCKTELSFEDVEMLDRVCKEEGIEFMASVFDIKRISWLEDLNVKRYKIASRSIHEENLINAVIETGKPVLISLGMWKQESFPSYSGNISYLYCISKYPTPLNELDFSKIDFSSYAGFSDHTEGVVAPITALARGAKIIEKHFTIDKTMHGPDHSGSMTPEELTEICNYRDSLKECM